MAIYSTLGFAFSIVKLVLREYSLTFPCNSIDHKWADGVFNRFDKQCNDYISRW